MLRNPIEFSLRLALVVVLAAVALSVPATLAASGFTLDDVARLVAVRSAVISPDGTHVAYTVSRPRDPYAADDGAAWSELHVAGPEPGRTRAFVAGEVQVSQIAWRPDGQAISFVAKRGKDEHKTLYAIPVDGGEAVQLVAWDTDLIEYSWSPDSKQIAFLATDKKDPDKKKRAKKGFKAEIYEEELRPVHIRVATLQPGKAVDEARLIEADGSASELHWSPDGDRIVVALAPTPLIDDRYMKRKVHVLDVVGGEVLARIENPGKLGDVRWSPDGRLIAMISAADLHDPNASRLLLAPAAGGDLLEVAPAEDGDIAAFGFIDDDTLGFIVYHGVESYYATVGVDGSGRKIVVAEGGPALRSVSIARQGGRVAFTADAPDHPGEAYALAKGEAVPARLSDSNPWLAERTLARQEAISYRARDGLEVQAVLIRPLDEAPGQRYPLIVVVHGGPEAHHSNGWLTRYSSPGQFAAAEGYAVLYPNYRGSTGRGVAYSKLDQADYARAEFNDLVDGVKHLVAEGLVDESKVGVTGGSYGGFASAWCATKLTEHFAASVMFVGISEQISKFGTTDIPNEMFLVHARRWPWDYWDWFRESSPVYYAEKARTPILILHGKDDTRVHPSQSLVLYRYLKTLGNVPVRLVLYPGEGHGNTKAAARLDYSMRMMRWMDHYLKGPGGDPPPHDLDLDPDKLEADDEDTD